MSYTIFELSEGYKSGKLNPESVIKNCLERVSSRDQWNTFITITDKLAYECLNNISDHKESDLYGIPIAFKDAIDIEGYVTSNGAVTEGVETSKKSAELVRKFIGKGAVVIGKNNLYDFSSGVTSINKIHGDVINPINKEVTAGGSSGGSAAAVAAGLVPCAVGADTSGSVRVPAACCGVVGLKLAYNPGLHSGITPLSSTLDHIGFFTQDIRDMEIVYNSLFIKNSVESINYDKAIKIGIPNVYFNENLDEEINHMMDSVYKKLKNIYCEFVNVDTTFLENFDFIKASRGIGTPEFAFLHHENFTFHPELYSEGLKETFKRGRLISSFEYLTALKDKEQIKFEMNKIFNQVDIILTPTMPIVPPGIETELVINGNNQFDIGDIMIKYTSIFNLSGHPAVSIPSGYESNGISLGIQLIANADDTPLLFKLGSLYESIRDK